MFAACILPGCTTSDEPDSVTRDEREMLSLTVRVSDIVESNGAASRSIEERDSTRFVQGDTVGLIVLDKAENLLVDNVPYRFDGTNWNFVGDVDKQPYYDAAMWTYIVYYPYKNEVDGCKTVDDIKSKDAFKEH